MTCDETKGVGTGKVMKGEIHPRLERERRMQEEAGKEEESIMQKESFATWKA